MTSEPTPVDDYFRSHLPNQSEQDGRKWLYPREPVGRYTRARTVVAWVLLVVLLAGPFVWVDGHPVFLLNVLERRFILFSVPFWPQDFYLVAIGLLTFIIFIAVFTVAYGRVWCGWACPQTIFMESVFRRVETWIEGDFRAKQRLDAAPWTAEKIAKKSAKHGVFLLIAFVIGNTFLTYLIGRDGWLAIVTDAPTHHLGGLSAMLLFTGLFYGVFAHLREIVCTTICPYGRLQSVLLDQHSLVVAYDDRRGEPRGKRQGARGIGQGVAVNADNNVPHALSPAPLAPKGDCVACNLCVQVCPTGIDIRNGLQMECIHCTACMDACDGVMDKVARPRGLIRLASEWGIRTGQPFRFTPRLYAHTAVLVGLLSLLTYLLLSRPPLEVTLLRAPGQLFSREPGGRISNLYTVEVLNKTYRPLSVQLVPTNPAARLRFVQPITTVPPGESVRAVLFISLPVSSLRRSSLPLTVSVLSGSTEVDHVETRFLGP